MISTSVIVFRISYRKGLVSCQRNNNAYVMFFLRIKNFYTY
jgi:hypothetical protein